MNEYFLEMEKSINRQDGMLGIFGPGVHMMYERKSGPLLYRCFLLYPDATAAVTRSAQKLSWDTMYSYVHGATDIFSYVSKLYRDMTTNNSEIIFGKLGDIRRLLESKNPEPSPALDITIKRLEELEWKVKRKLQKP